MSIYVGEKSINGYDAIILGSAIHGGKWLPEAVNFLQTNRKPLNRIPVAFFLVGLMMNRKSKADQKLIDGFLEAERAIVKPVSEGRFTGKRPTSCGRSGIPPIPGVLWSGLAQRRFSSTGKGASLGLEPAKRSFVNRSAGRINQPGQLILHLLCCLIFLLKVINEPLDVITG